MITEIKIEKKTKLVLNDVSTLVFDLKDKHLAVVYGDWQKKEELINSIKLLKEMVEFGRDENVPVEYCRGQRYSFTFDIPNIGKVEYQFSVEVGSVTEEMLAYKLNSRKVVVFSKKKDGSVNLHRELFKNEKCRKIIDVELMKNRLSILKLCKNVFDFYLWKHSNLEEKLDKLLYYIESIKVPNVSEVLDVRNSKKSEMAAIEDFMPFCYEVAVVDGIDGIINPLLLKEVLTKAQEEKLLTGQLILFYNSLELMEMPDARNFVFLAGADGVKCVKDYERRTFKNNNVRCRYLAGDYGALPR